MDSHINSRSVSAVIDERRRTAQDHRRKHAPGRRPQRSRGFAGLGTTSLRRLTRWA